MIRMKQRKRIIKKPINSKLPPSYPPITDNLAVELVSLVQELKYGDPKMQKKAEREIRNYGPEAKSYIEPLLHHEKWQVRVAAIRLMGSLDGPSVMEHLANPDENIRHRAALALEESDTLDTSVVPKLKEAHDSEPTDIIRKSIKRVLEKMGIHL